MDEALDKKLEGFKASGETILVIAQTTAPERSAVHKWVETNPSAAVRAWVHESRSVGSDRQLHLIKPDADPAAGAEAQVKKSKPKAAQKAAPPPRAAVADGPKRKSLAKQRRNERRAEARRLAEGGAPAAVVAAAAAAPIPRGLAFHGTIAAVSKVGAEKKGKKRKADDDGVDPYAGMSRREKAKAMKVAAEAAEAAAPAAAATKAPAAAPKRKADDDGVDPYAGMSRREKAKAIKAAEAAAEAAGTAAGGDDGDEAAARKAATKAKNEAAKAAKKARFAAQAGELAGQPAVGAGEEWAAGDGGGGGGERAASSGEGGQTAGRPDFKRFEDGRYVAFVGQLAYTATEEDIRRHFAANLAGSDSAVKSVRCVPRDSNSTHHPSCFV